MSEFMNTIDLLGDEETVKEIIERTITEFNDNICKSVGIYAFYDCKALASVNIPNVTSIGNYAFQGCSILTSVDIPNVTSIGNNAFQNCSALASVNLPKITSITGFAFTGCKALASVNIPNVTSISSYAFNGCEALISIDLPNVIGSIENNAFNGCKALTSVNIPKVTKIGYSAFGSCSALASINLPNVTSIDGAFFGCTNLNVIILGAQSVCTLKNTNAFNNTPFAAGKTGGTVYVPQSLITQYQTATNWSTLYAAGTCNFVAIEGSEYE